MNDQVVATRLEVAATLGLAPEDLDQLIVGLLPAERGQSKAQYTFAELSLLRGLSNNEIRHRVGLRYSRLDPKREDTGLKPTPRRQG